MNEKTGTDRPTDSRSVQQATERGILRSAGFVTILTFVSRLLGLVREQVRGYYLGTSMGSDAFGLASTIPNLFRRLLGEGAMTSAFVPVFTRYVKDGNPEELKKFLNGFLTIFIGILVAVSAIGIIASDLIINTFFSSGFGKVPGKVDLTITLTQLMFPYLALACLAAIVQAILNTYKIFAPSAFTPILLNLSIIIGTICLARYFVDASYGIAIGFLVGGVLQFVFPLWWIKKTGIPFRPGLDLGSPGIKELFRVFLPGVFSAGIYQIDVFVAEVIASTLSPGSIAALQYSIRLQELVLGVFVISMTTVILPTLSRQHVDGDKDGFERTTAFSLRFLGLVTIPASFALITLRKPIVAVLFNYGAFNSDSIDMTSFAVLFHSLGIYFIATSRSLNQSFYAKKNLKTPMYIALVTFLVNASACFGLSHLIGHGGIAAANSLSAAVSAGLLYVMLHRSGVRLGFRSQASFVVRCVVASSFMAVSALGLMEVLPWDGLSRLSRAGMLFIYIVVSLLCFLAAAMVLLRQDIRRIAGLLRKQK